MSYTPTLYRLVIVDPDSANTFTPGDTTVHADHLSVDSRRTTTTRNYITESPSDDGDRLDILAGTIDDAACRVSVSDASAYVTGQLADAGARFQLQGREAYVEQSTDAGSSWTIVRHGFVTDIELPRAQAYLITIGGARHKERNNSVARIWANVDNPLNEVIFRPTAIIGGPIFGGLPGYLPNVGLPTFRVHSKSINGDGNGYVRLDYVTGPLPPFYPNTVLNQLGPPIGLRPTAEAEYINQAARLYFEDKGILFGSPSDPIHLRGNFAGIGVHLFDAIFPSTRQFGPLRVAGQKKIDGATIVGQGGDIFMGSNSGKSIYIEWEAEDGTAPDVAEQFGLAAIPRVMSEAFPLWYAGHPLVVANEAESLIGVTLEATSLTAAYTALGLEHYHVGRFTDPKRKIQTWLEQLGSFFGFALVLDPTSTEYAVIPTHNRPSGSPPSITDDDLREIGGPTYKLAANSRRNTLRVTVDQFVVWNGAMNVDLPYSWLVDFRTPFEETYSADDTSVDSEDYGEHLMELSLDGTVLLTGQLTSSVTPAPLGLSEYIQGLAARLFDRHGRGAAEYQFALTGAAAIGSVPLGGYVSMATSHLPNAQPNQTPSAQRGGTRPARLIAITHPPNGDEVTLLDEGAGATYAPTFDITGVTASATPGFFDVAFDGILAVAADNGRIDVYVGITAAGVTTEPTGPGVRVITYSFGSGTVDDTYGNIIGPFPTGGNCWFRAEAWVDGWGRSASTAWWNTNGASTPPPSPPPAPAGTISALTIADIGTDYAVLTWTNTDTTEPIVVSYKLDTDTTYTPVVLLPPGSNQYTVMGLVPATDYDFQVQLVSAVNGAVYVTLTVSGTTDSGTPTLVLFTPLNPRAYSGTGMLLGSCGLIVQPVFNTPHEVEFEMTPETAVGSGVPDGWPSDVTPAPDSESQSWPVNSATPGAFGSVDVFSIHNVANDGRLRFFRARARKIQSDGSIIYSGWTTVVSVMPWIVFVPLPPPGAGSLVDGGTAYVTGPNQVDGGSDVANNTYSGPPLEGGSA